MMRPEFRKHLSETLLTAVDFARAQDRVVRPGGSYFWDGLTFPKSYGLCLFGAVEMMMDLPHRSGQDNADTAAALGITVGEAKRLEAGFCGWDGHRFGGPGDEFFDFGRKIARTI